MTAKDYIIIADTIAKLPDHSAGLRAHKKSVAVAFCESLKAENPAFNQSLFLAACGF